MAEWDYTGFPVRIEDTGRYDLGTDGPDLPFALVDVYQTSRNDGHIYGATVMTPREFAGFAKGHPSN